MPAAAVIPAPLVYIKVVAVKKLVVEPRVGGVGLLRRGSSLRGRSVRGERKPLPSAQRYFPEQSGAPSFLSRLRAGGGGRGLAPDMLL